MPHKGKGKNPQSREKKKKPHKRGKKGAKK